MRRGHLVTAILILAGVLVEPCAAQTMSIYNTRGPRVSARVGYGDPGFDWDTSIDSPLIADRLRFRGGLGQGLWDSEFDGYRGTVTRVAASAIYFIASPPELRPYIGLGLARLIPRGSDVVTQTGNRLILGMEGSGERWTVGVELEIDLPRYRTIDAGSVAREQLYPTGRIGLAIRRAF
jgi:hypothetical protein